MTSGYRWLTKRTTIRTGLPLTPAHPRGGTLHQDGMFENLFSNWLMDTGLQGARVLVTGGSGGIGAACVRLFAAEGADVVVHYHRGRERAQAAGGSRIVQADLRDERDVDRMFAEAGELDVCAAVAGAWPAEDMPVAELSLERWRETLD